jgi:hypothetical protein
MERTYRAVVTYLLAFLIVGCGGQVDTSVVVLPRNYKGLVIIIYDQPNGIPISKKGGKVLHQVPGNGIVLTQDEDHFGSYNLTTFYYESIADSNQLKRALTFEEVGNDPVVYGGRVSRINRSAQEMEDVRYISYCVGNRDEILDCQNNIDRLNVEQFVE